ncbi:MAG: YbaK/EbsC family protein [Pseudomonadota bacterium]
MFVSEITQLPPASFISPLQGKVYDTLSALKIPFERVDTDTVITMEDCAAINDRLNMNMVKTLFLTNAQRSRFYLFVSRGDKAFQSKAFSQATGSSRVSFAPREEFEARLGVEIGAATIFSKMLDPDNAIQLALDVDVVGDEYYGCSDGTTTSYLKLRTSDVVERFLPHIGCVPTIVSL